MKKSLFLLFFIASGLCSQAAFAQETSDQNNTTQIDMMDTPFFKEVKTKIMKDIQDSFYQNKDELMAFLKESQNYTEEEYLKLYNGYETNPPFVEKDGVLELNPDYETKNTKYIEENGIWVENPNYVEKPVYQTQTEIAIEKVIPQTKTQKRLGKKSFNINPDSFN